MKKILKYITLTLTFSVLFLLKASALTYDENNTITLPEKLKLGEYNEIQVNLSTSYSASYIIKDVSNNSDFMDAYATYKLNPTAGKDGFENIITGIISDGGFETIQSDYKIKPDNISIDTDKTVLLVVKAGYNDSETGENIDIYKYKVYEYSPENKTTPTNENKTEEKNSDTGITDVLYIAVPALLIIGTVTLNKKRYE